MALLRFGKTPALTSRSISSSIRSSTVIAIFAFAMVRYYVIPVPRASFAGIDAAVRRLASPGVPRVARADPAGPAARFAASSIPAAYSLISRRRSPALRRLSSRRANGSEAKLRRGPVGGRLSGTTLAATNDLSAGSVCKRRDAVTLGRKKGLQPRASERPAGSFSFKLGRAVHLLTLKPRLRIWMRYKRVKSALDWLA